LDKLLSTYLDKEHATLHWDGQPSLQKSSERQKRQEALDGKLAKIQELVDLSVSGKKSIHHASTETFDKFTGHLQAF
jgi:hypothetical protein